MTVEDPPPRPPEQIEIARPRKWSLAWFRSKLKLNKSAAKALESADVVFGSMPIPGASVVAEIKDVALIAITD